MSDVITKAAARHLASLAKDKPKNFSKAERARRRKRMIAMNKARNAAAK